jgi:hypothetical protein
MELVSFHATLGWALNVRATMMMMMMMMMMMISQ